MTFLSTLCFQCNILFSARRYKLQLFTGFRRRVVVIFPSADEWKRRLSQHQMNDREQIPGTALLKLQRMSPAYFIGNVTFKWFNKRMSQWLCSNTVMWVKLLCSLCMEWLELLLEREWCFMIRSSVGCRFAHQLLYVISLLPVSCSLPEQQSDLLEELQYTELPQEQAQVLLQEYKDEAHRLLPPILKQEKKKPRLYNKRPHPHGSLPSHRIQWSRTNGQHEIIYRIFWDLIFKDVSWCDFDFCLL